ncbi:MAG: hypothetical protein IPJ41_09025 [Phycisphaerales bacterium]|nr:hypothetical protein [Phycisphaerales bacterium]
MMWPAVLLLTAAVCAGPEGDLVLRGHEPAPVGQVREVGPEGVVVGSAVAGSVIVGWDRVLQVGGDHAPEAAAFEQVADEAWRASARLERGDTPAAEPLFERLFAKYQGARGPTAAVVAEGLLRCRLHRNAHTLAVSAWLAWLNARRQGDGPQWYQPRAWTADEQATIQIDASTGLIGDLPPIWLDLPAVRVFAGASMEGGSFGPREQSLAVLYRHAAQTELGVSEPMPRPDSNDEAVRLVWDVVAAQSLIDTERAAGRKAVESRLRKEPSGWLEAWLRIALARSLVREPDPEQQRRGVIELIRVRVAHDRDDPYLAGLALAEAAVTLRAMGQDAGAGELRRELLDRFPGHPATLWDRIVVWPAPASADALMHTPRAGTGASPLTTDATRESRTSHG